MRTCFLRSASFTALLLGCVFSFSGCQEKAPETAAAATPKPYTPTLLNQAEAVDTLTAYGQKYPHDTLVLIQTSKGDIKVRLFKDTPLHRANFVRLAHYGFFDKTVFFRVEKGFMIQGGRTDQPNMKIGGYDIPQEIRPHYYHKRGVLGMARYGDEENPERMSSARDFYIVQGHPLSPEELAANIQEFKLNLSPEQKEVYRTQGGAPNLDGRFTIFGEVIEGMHVVDSIANVPVDKQQNWPLTDVTMKVRVIRQ